MAATKRKIYDVEAESEVDVEKKRAALERLTEDRLSNLPEALQLRILACLDAKYAVQTILLSKNWVNLWTRIPVLDLNYLSFNNPCAFKPFFEQVVLRRDPSAKLERLKFNGSEFCSAETLKSVFDYAFLHGVNQLEALMDTFHGSNDYRQSWPLSVCDSLTSLKLQTDCDRCLIKCPGLGSLKNLAVLYLKSAHLTDSEPFSGFPVLESLALLYCYTNTDTKTLRVQSLRLSNLDISYCSFINGWELKTPRLKYLEYRGDDFPKYEDLPVLETLKFEFYFFCSSYSMGKEKEKRMNGDLMSLFSTISNVKSLTLFKEVVLLLSFFPDELVRRGSPFHELKDFTLDLSCGYLDAPHLCHEPGKFESVKAYLLGNSPHANFTIIPSSIDLGFFFNAI